MSGRWRSRLVTPVGRQGDGVELAEDDLTDVWHASRSLAMTAFALTVAAVVGFALPGGPHLDFAAAAVGSYAALLVLSLALLRVRPCIAPGSPGNVQLALVVAAAVSGALGSFLAMPFAVAALGICALADAFHLSVVARRRALSLFAALRLTLRKALAARRVAWEHTLRTGTTP